MSHERIVPRPLATPVAFCLACAFLVAGHSAVAGDGKSEPGTDKTGGRVVTVTHVKGDDREWLVTLDPATSRWEKITPAGGHARISPDGSTAAFGIGTGVWTVPLKPGATPRRVGEVGGAEAMQKTSSADLIWEPDGKALIATGFRGVLPTITLETYVYGIDGRARTKMPIPKNEGVDDISPDGRWLVTGRDTGDDASSGLFKTRRDGSGGVRLVQGNAFTGRFSPDGTKILYTLNAAEVADEGLFVIDADGSNRRQIHPRAASGCWSPDGKRIAFVCLPGPPAFAAELKDLPPDDALRYVGRLVVVDSDGKDRQFFATPTGLPASQPDWR